MKQNKQNKTKQVLSKMDHYYSNLLPTTMNHFELLSKELSYHLFRKQQKLLENEQHNSVDNPHSHSRSSSSLNLQNNFIEIAKTNEKLRDEIRTSMSEYLLCVKEVSSLFSLLVSQFLKQNENNKNDSIDFIELFHSTRTDNLDIDTMSDISTDNESELRSQTGDSTGDDANDNSNSNNNADATGKNDGNNTNNEETRVRKLINKQRLWLIRFGLRIMSGLYWWHSVEYIPLNGDVKNDKNESKEKENNANTNNINRRKITPKETFFVKCLNPIIADVMLKGLEQIGLNVETLLNLQNHVKSYVIVTIVFICNFRIVLFFFFFFQWTVYPFTILLFFVLFSVLLFAFHFVFFFHIVHRLFFFFLFVHDTKEWNVNWKSFNHGHCIHHEVMKIQIHH